MPRSLPGIIADRGNRRKGYSNNPVVKKAAKCELFSGDVLGEAGSGLRTGGLVCFNAEPYDCVRQPEGPLVSSASAFTRGGRKGNPLKKHEPAREPFGQALMALLRERDEYLTRAGQVKLRAFARDLDDFSSEALRKAVIGERPPSEHLMEECARVLQESPEYFAEYRVMQARRMFDVGEVGFETALRNFEQWARSRSRR